MRNQYTIAGLALVLALAVSMMAAQTSSSQSPTPGQATAPTQGTPSTQPGSEPQASPQAPAGAQSQTAPQEQSGSQSRVPSPGQAAGRGSSAEDELQLTEDQKARLQPIIQDEMIQIDAVRTDNSLTMEQKQAKVAQIKKDHFPKIEAILTPEQRKKLADMQERARQQRQGTSGNQSNPRQRPQ